MTVTTHHLSVPTHDPNLNALCSLYTGLYSPAKGSSKLQAELAAAAEQAAYLKEKEEKRLRSLATAKPPEVLLARAREAAAAKEETIVSTFSIANH